MARVVEGRYTVLNEPARIGDSLRSLPAATSKTADYASLSSS